MRILLVTHYFPPETGAPQARLSALAAAWAADGDAVTVLTGMPNHPTGVIPAEYRHAIWRLEHRDGYRVLSNRPVIGLLERLELAAYAAADLVVVVSDGFRANLIGRGVPPEKVHTIRNGACPGSFDPAAAAD